MRLWVGMVQGLIGGRRGLRWARVLRRLLGVSDAICVMGGFFFSESSFVGVWGAYPRGNWRFECGGRWSQGSLGAFAGSLEFALNCHSTLLCVYVFHDLWLERDRESASGARVWILPCILCETGLLSFMLLDEKCYYWCNQSNFFAWWFSFLLLYQSFRYNFADNCSFRFLLNNKLWHRNNVEPCVLVNRFDYFMTP